MNPEPITILPSPTDGETSSMRRRESRATAPIATPRHRNLFRPLALSSLTLGLLAFGIWLGRQDSIDRLLTFESPTADADLVTLEGGVLDAGAFDGTPDAIPAEANTRQFVGIVYPGRSAAVTAPFSGHITSLADVAFGATVDQGDLILTIDSAEARRELKQAEMATREAESEFLKLQGWSTSSDVMQAKREMENARREVQRAAQRSERTKLLLDEGIIARTEYEQELETLQISESSLELAIDGHRNVLAEGSQDRIDLAKQRFLLAKEEYETLESAIDRQRLEAPQSGILLPPPNNDASSGAGQPALTIGRTVQKGEALIVIGDIETVQIKTFVSDVDIDQLELGQRARILNSTFTDRDVIGAVQSISKYTANFQNANATTSDMGPSVSRYEVNVEVPVAELGIVDKIRVGMTVDIEIGDLGDTSR